MEELWLWDFLDTNIDTFPSLTAAREAMDNSFAKYLGREWDEVAEDGIHKGALWVRWPGERWKLTGHRLYRATTNLSDSPASARLVAA